MERQDPTPSRRSFLTSSLAATALLVGGYRPVLGQDIAVEEILSDASKRLAEVKSLHFTLEVEGETFIDETGAIRLESAEGDLSRPDKVAVEFQVSLFGTGTVSIRMITIGDESWTTDLITGNWGEAPPEFGYDPSRLYDNQDGLGPVMGKLDEPVIVDIEEIDDRDCNHIKGAVQNDVVSAVTAGTMTGDPVGIDLWIDTETSDLRRVKLIEPDSDDKDKPATWQLNLSEHGEEVAIEPPS